MHPLGWIQRFKYQRITLNPGFSLGNAEWLHKLESVREDHASGDWVAEPRKENASE